MSDEGHNSWSFASVFMCAFICLTFFLVKCSSNNKETSIKAFEMGMEKFGPGQYSYPKIKKAESE